jgi:hypothetical protein
LRKWIRPGADFECLEYESRTEQCWYDRSSPRADRIAELESVVRQLQDRNEILELAARYHQLCDGGWDGAWRHVTYAGELVRTAERWRFASWKSRGADLPPA